MSGRMKEAEKKYIVYKLIEDERKNDSKLDEFFEEHNVTSLPTLIIFKDGKEVRRHTGVVELKDLVEGVKTKKEQKKSWWDYLKLY